MYTVISHVPCMQQVRGPKVIVRWFSHDVADLEFVLSLIEAQDMDDHDVSIGHVTHECHVTVM